MFYSIPIFPNNEIDPIFVKANSKLLKHEKIRNTKELVLLWKEVYQADLDLLNYTINFDNEQTKLHFVLNHS